MKWIIYAGLQGYSEFQVAVAAQTAVGTGPYFMVPPNKTLESGKILQVLCSRASWCIYIPPI